MAKAARVRLFRKKVIRPYRGRGETYSWLRAHHAKVVELIATWAWADLVEEMLRDGLQGRDGVVVTPKAATKVWQRVCRDVEADAKAAAAAPPKRKFPSRISPDWRPQVVPQPVIPPPPIRHPLLPSSPPPPGSLGSVERTPEEIARHVQEQDEIMDALFAEHDAKFRF